MKTIVWDLDDVLNNLMEEWLKQAWRVEHPEKPLAFSRLSSNPPHTLLGISAAEYLASLDCFRLSPAGQALAPNVRLLSWFERHGGRFRHHVLTARPVNTVAVAAAWVFTHFGRWVRDFHFVPSPRPGESLTPYDRDKAVVLCRLGPVDFFVDDSPAHVAEAARLGIQAFLFPQPWNGGEQSVDFILGSLVPGVNGSRHMNPSRSPGGQTRGTRHQRHRRAPISAC